LLEKNSVAKLRTRVFCIKKLITNVNSEPDPAQSFMYFQLGVPMGMPTSYFKTLLQNKLIADTGRKSTGTSQAWLEATLSTE